MTDSKYKKWLKRLDSKGEYCPECGDVTSEADNEDGWICLNPNCIKSAYNRRYKEDNL
jgi:ribosomal protein S27AE